MKEALATSGVFARGEQGLINSLLSLPVIILLTTNPLATVGITTLFFFLGSLRIGPFEIGTGLAGGFVAVAGLVALNEIFVPNFQFGGPAVTGVALLLGLVFAVVFSRRMFRAEPQVPLLAATLFSSLCVWSTWSWNFLSIPEYLSILANTQSSYSQSLSSLAQSVTISGINLNAESSGVSGPLLGIVFVAIRTLISWLHPGSSMTMIENAKVLIQILLVITVLILIVWLGVAAAILKSRTPIVRTIYSVVFAFVSAMFGLGLVRVGRIDVLVSYLMISLAVLVFASLAKELMSFKSLPWLMTAIFLLSAGMSWLPAVGLGLFFIFVLTGKEICRSCRLRQLSWSSKYIFLGVVYTAAISTTIVALFWRSSFWQAVTLPIRNISDATLPGGTSAIHPLLVFIAISGAIWWTTRQSEATQNSITISLVSALVGTPVILFVSSYFFEPRMPSDSVWVLMYLVMAVLVCLSSIFVIATIPNSKKIRILEWLIGPVFLLAMFSLLSPQMSNMDWLNDTDWVSRRLWSNPCFV